MGRFGGKRQSLCDVVISKGKTGERLIYEARLQVMTKSCFHFSVQILFSFCCFVLFFFSHSVQSQRTIGKKMLKKKTKLLALHRTRGSLSTYWNAGAFQSAKAKNNHFLIAAGGNKSY